MAGPAWIRGKSVDCRDRLEIEQHPKFVDYLVHLQVPACTMVVGHIGLSDETKIPHDADAGFFYQNENSGIELVILRWHGRPPEDARQISNVLYDASSHLLCEQIDMHDAAMADFQE